MASTLPFWQAWWFYSLVFLAVGAVIYLLDRERMRRRKAERQMRTKIADHLHAEIRTALNSIHVLSEIGTIKAGKDPDKAADYLGQIKSKSQQMLNAMDDILWVIEPENDSMSRIVARIEDYAQKVRSSGQAEMELMVDPKVGDLVLDMQQRQMLLRLVKESINGLLRAGVRKMQVALGRDKEQLTFVIHFGQGEVDMTILNNFLQAWEMTNLMADISASCKMVQQTSNCEISFYIPL
ncbi:MAG: hypothetical protein JNK77_15865 [Saprospiraceae bacterium]|nr:hypothetical protein [Saprospiraceae bacterium]